MKRRLKLLAFAVALMVALSVASALIYQATEQNNRQSNPNSIRVACVGDSITGGFEYTDDLWMMLGANYTVDNFGTGGASVTLSGETPYMRQPVFHQSIRFKPNIVVIMLGSNDANPGLQRYNGTFVADYLTLIGKFQALSTKPQIWIVKPPHIFNNGTGLSTEFFDSTVIPNIETVAQQANLPLIDVYSDSANHSDYFFDGVHPNSKGCQLIAQVVYEALSLY